MADGYRLCWCLFFTFAIICSARNTILLSADDIAVMAMEGRSLTVNVDDYSEATANHGHDPKNKAAGSGSRKSRDYP